MRAAWWWIDRWRKSTAYTDMTAEQQGVYRNLLDELWLRDGAIPNDERILAKIGGDAEAWPRVRVAVLARFEITEQGLRHSTHDEVALGSSKFHKSQSDKGKAGAEARWSKARSEKENGPAINPAIGWANGLPSPSPSPSPYQTPITEAQTIPTTALVLVSAPSEPPVDQILPAQYVGVFNAVFSRALGVSPEVARRIKARLRDGYRPWQLIALPIMVDAQPALAADMRRGLNPLMLLRDGKSQKTGADGKTWGATDWLEREIGRLDRTVLSPRLADIAKQANVLEQLMACGAAVRQAS